MDKDLFHALFCDIDGCYSKKLVQGETLFHQGDPARLVFSVISGELRLMRYGQDGSATCLHTSFDGESFAAAALFVDNYHCNGEAGRVTEVWCYPRAAVLQRLDQDIACRDQVFALLATEVRYLRSLLELRSTTSASERVGQFLRHQADANGTVHFRRPLVHLARELGMAHETFYRALAELEKNGVVQRVDRRSFQLLNSRD